MLPAMTFRGRFDSEDFNFEDELSKQRDERSSPLVLIAGVVALVVGLFVWGSIAMSVLSSGEDADAAGNREPAAADEPAADEDDDSDADGAVPIDCSALEDELALSPAREAQYRGQCGTPTPEPPAGPAATATPDTRPNRGDCNVIRGTAYNSPEERQWFLANCVAR